jgi:hypothetical protein
VGKCIEDSKLFERKLKNFGLLRLLPQLRLLRLRSHLLLRLLLVGVLLMSLSSLFVLRLKNLKLASIMRTDALEIAEIFVLETTGIIVVTVLLLEEDPDPDLETALEDEDLEMAMILEIDKVHETTTTLAADTILEDQESIDID